MGVPYRFDVDGQLNMWTDLWALLQDEKNRVVLSWLGGGLVVVVAGLWAVFKLLHRKPGTVMTITADRGGIAAGGNVNTNPPPAKRRH